MDFQFVSSYFLEPGQSLNLGSVIMRSLTQADQRACLVLTMYLLVTDVCCINEARILNFSSLIQPTAPEDEAATL